MEEELGHTNEIIMVGVKGPQVVRHFNLPQCTYFVGGLCE